MTAALSVTNPATSILEMRNISNTFGTARAINEVELTIYPGEAHALVCENGVGKSTLLETAPKVLILDEPTRGVDIGAKSETYRVIDDLARSGAAVLVISSELPGIVAIGGRVVVMREGDRGRSGWHDGGGDHRRNPWRLRPASSLP